MGIRFACHVCEKQLNIKQEFAGRRGICPACSSRIRIPMQNAEKSAPIVENKIVAAAVPNPALTESAAPESANGILDGDPDGAWYVRPPSGGQYGPASSEVLKEWVNQGRVASTTLLWRDGWPQWRDASEVLPELS